MTMMLGFLALYTFYQESVIFIVTLALLVYPLTFFFFCFTLFSCRFHAVD